MCIFPLPHSLTHQYVMRALSSSSKEAAALFFASSTTTRNQKKTTTKAALSFSKRRPPPSLSSSSSSSSSSNRQNGIGILTSSSSNRTNANICERGVLVVSSASPSTSAARGAVVTVTRWKGTTYDNSGYTNKYCPKRRTRVLRRVENNAKSSSECDEDHQKVSNTYKSGGDDDFATKKNTHHTDVLARALELDQKVTGKGASRLCCFFLSFFLTLRRCCLSVWFVAGSSRCRIVSRRLTSDVNARF